MYYIIFAVINFLTPSIKLNSGKSIDIKGNGPPLLFSTGLFGIMPNFLYSNIQNKLSKNFTLILNTDYKPLLYKDIEDITDKLQVDYISLFSHSSINDKILESNYINKIVLCDPITIPNINFDGFSNKKITPSADILSIKAEKLYNSDIILPEYQNPIIVKNKLYSDTIYKDVGHPDILDNMWADLAISSSLWRGASYNKYVFKFKDWKFSKKNNNKKEIFDKRENYRKFIVNKTINFILE